MGKRGKKARRREARLRRKIKKSQYHFLERKKYLRIKSKELNDNLPKSEVWFWNKWREIGMAIESDRPNKPLFGCIPDISNKIHMYIIEIDGSIHNNPEVKKTDEKRERLYARGGYYVVRVKAYSEESFANCVDLIRRRRIEKVTTKGERQKSFAQDVVLAAEKDLERIEAIELEAIKNSTIIEKYKEKERERRRKIEELKRGRKHLSIEEIRKIAKERASAPNMGLLKKSAAAQKTKEECKERALEWAKEVEDLKKSQS